MEVRGEFEVTMTPVATEGEGPDPPIGLIRLDKKYRGPLSGSSQGQMLAHRTAVAGSAGYTAMEKVTGSLDGKSGSFMLLHFGEMTKGTPTKWGVSVVPDSGTDELAGLKGEMEIVIEGGKHEYVLRYEIGDG